MHYLCNMIERLLLIDSIKRKFEKFPCVILLGLRQVGKTTISKSLFASDVKYLDLEKPKDKYLLEAGVSEYLENFFDSVVVIDEVQLLPFIFSELRPIIDSNKKSSRFVLLGSANPTLVRGVSESLTGRAAYIDILPLSIEEVGVENYQKRWLRGGLPMAYTAETNVDAFEWLDEYLRSYIERDFSMLFGIQINVNIARRMLKIVASVNGSTLNTSDLSRSLGVSNSTTNNYLDLLEGGYFINRLQPYFPNVSKRVVKSPKLYISDEGILHSLANINTYESLIDHVLVGASWEGFVINQIRSIVGKKVELYFYRTQVGAEIDLLIVKDNRPYVAIEIKNSNTPSISKGFYLACEDVGVEHKYIITKSEGGYTLKNARVIGLVDFLTKELDNLIL
ncbi:MAG: ATP-binding protein [Saprospiraceae bacterium]|jgi:predicted AAA+ superfamily ATPase|nr:ATP-binding protein [Saprospiraceae bacterium]